MKMKFTAIALMVLCCTPAQAQDCRGPLERLLGADFGIACEKRQALKEIAAGMNDAMRQANQYAPPPPAVVYAPAPAPIQYPQLPPPPVTCIKIPGLMTCN